MKRLVACAVVAALVASVFARPASVRAQVLPILIVEPSEGHTGDAIYLSGGNFEPSTQLLVTIACPVWFYSPLGNVESINGQVTDHLGRFVKLPWHVMALNGETSSPCRIYASYGTNPFAVSVPFTIKAPSEPLSPCARSICVKVSAALHGSLLSLTVRGWPGATVTVTITYPNRSTQRVKTDLDWRGERILHVTVKQHLTHLAPARFQVHADMQNMHGITSGRFPASAPRRKQR